MINAIKANPWRSLFLGLWALFWVRQWMVGMSLFWAVVFGVGIWFVCNRFKVWDRLLNWGEVNAIRKQDANHVRGARLAESADVVRRIYANEQGLTGLEAERLAYRMKTDPKNHPMDAAVFDKHVRIAGVPIPRANENLHLAIAASTGAGKSVSLRGLLADIRRRGDRAIVIDNGSEFMRKFGQADDLVLSPFDERSQGWDVRNEVRAKHDWLRLANSVIPDGHGSDKPWHDMAQKLFGNIGVNVGEATDNKALLEIATSYTPAQLEPILAGGSSAVLTQDGGERLLTNIRSVYASTLQSWPFMKSGDFSLRDYMQGEDRRWLFIPFKESEFGVSKSMIATWMDILVSAGLEREEGAHQTWLIIDELDTLGALSSLIAATTKLRKRGVCVVVAFQSYSQLAKNYGDDSALTLLNCFSNKLVMRSVDGETAERLSKELGEREVWKESHSRGRERSTTQSQQIERLVLPAEIQNLPDLAGYLKLAGDYPVVKVQSPL
jgi:type IV secretory pathway TraG/TraD family ATPase VirD4